MIIGISGKAHSGKDTVGKIIQYLDWKQSVKRGESKSIHYSLSDFQKGNAVYLSNWKIKKFADTLKDITCMLIGCTREQLEDQEFKETPLGEEWNRYLVSWTSKDEGVDGTFPSYDEAYEQAIKLGATKEDIESYQVIVKIQMTPRKLMQLLGTEAGREIIHPNIWVNALFAEYENVLIKPTQSVYSDKANNSTGILNIPPEYGKPNWIITDCRFPNELQAVKDRGGVSIRVNRNRFRCSNCSELVVGRFNCQNCGTDQLIDEPYSNHPSETSLDKADFDYIINNNSSIEDLILKVKQILEKEQII